MFSVEAKIQDYSMFTVREVQVARAKEIAEKGGVSNTQNIGTHAFDDLTDLQNDEFIVGLDFLLNIRRANKT